MERFRNITIIFLLAVILPASAALSQSASVLLQEGLHAEQIKGDLDAAIEIYERVLKDFPRNRPVAAKALLHIGSCYEKLGKQEAQKAYQRLVQEFSDQQKIVAEAIIRLSRLKRLASAVQAEDIVIRKLMDASGAGFHGGGEPSPDGKYFCFIDWETYPHDIVIKEIGTKIEIRLRNKGDLSSEGHVGIPYFPTWSPDSKKIAYTWESDEGQYIELRFIEIDNPEPDILIKVDYLKGWVTAVDWSPDGQHILVLHSENDQDQLGLISIADNSFHPLKKFDYHMPSAAKFSPNGHHIAYDLPPNKEDTNHDIYVLSVDGRRQVKLTSHPSHDYLIDWSPTGKKILFASDRTGTTDVWSISFDERAPQAEPKLITENIGVITPLGCTRNGSFYFSTPGSWWDIYTVTIDPNTGKIEEPPAEIPLPYQGYNKHPAWSPNGKYLAYVSMRELQRRKNILCIYSIETGKVQEFDYKHNISHPRWFFDSKSILVNGTDVLRIDTGEITPFIQEKDGQAVYSPNISPDKKHLYYVRRNKNLKTNSIISRDLETDKEKELYRTADDNFTMALSPDGKQLALLFRHKENTRILKILSTMDGSAKDIHKFKLKEYRHISMAWSPDGRYIYFSKGEDEWELWRIPAAGGTAENLGVKMHGFANISIHPDGRRITFASFVGFERPGGIWVMENFLPKIEPKGMTVRKIWEGLDVDDCGKISPDGKYLSYVDWGRGDLAVYEIATGKKRHLTNKGSWDDSDEFAVFSRWSPDSKQIVYSWYNKLEHYDLRVIGVDGSKPHVLFSDPNCDSVHPCDWSSDGKRILARLRRKDSGEVVQISVMDGDVQVVKKLNKGGFDNFVFSPEGNDIIYDAPPERESGNHDIFLFSIESGTERALVKHPSHDYVLGWGSDGKHLLFASGRTGTHDIWAIKVVDGKALGAPQLIKSEKGPIPLTGLGSTTEGLFYYCNFPGRTDVYVTEIDPKTGEIVVPPREAINRFVGSNATPDYSSDGKYMAYVSRRGSFNTRINRPIGDVLCIRSLETGEDRELRSPGLNKFGYPRWSPDSRSVMVVNWEGDSRPWHMGHYVIDTQTGEAKLVVMTQKPQGIHHHAWSADGKSVFLVRSIMAGDRTDSMRMQIVAREIASGAETELLSGTWRDIYSISRSPNGRWLAVLGKGKKRSLRVIPATGGEPRIVHTFEQGDNRTTRHVWSADGKYIFLTKLRPPKTDLKWDLWRIPVEGGQAQSLGLEMNTFWWLSAHPDGRHIAFSNRTSDYDLPEVWVMENFLPGLNDRQ